MSRAVVPAADAAAKVSGSVPPSSQYMHGAPAAVASTPTSSLPVTTPGSITRCTPNLAVNAALIRSVAASSFTTAGKLWIGTMSGSRGAPDADASAWTIRVIAAITRSRTCGSKVRKLSPSSACSGITLSFAPACSLGSSGRCNTCPFRSCNVRIDGSSAAGSWCSVDGGAGELRSTGGARNEQRAGVPGGRCASDDGYAVAGRPEDGRQWRPGPLLPADRNSAGGDLGAVLVRGRAGADRRPAAHRPVDPFHRRPVGP